MPSSPSRGGISPKKATHTVVDLQVHGLHQKLTYGEDAIEATQISTDMDGPSYNMRTWAASNRRVNLAGGGPAGSSQHSGYSGSGGPATSTNATGGNAREHAAAAAKAKKMAKWDTSHVQEEVQEESFLNTGPSALLLTRKPPAIGPRERIQGMSSVVAAGSTAHTSSANQMALSGGHYQNNQSRGGSPLLQQRYAMMTSMGGGGPNSIQGGAPVTTSSRMRDTIARFKPKAQGNIDALEQLNQDADHYAMTHLSHAKLPFTVVPGGGKVHLEQDVLLPQRIREAQLRESEKLNVSLTAHLTMGGGSGARGAAALRQHDNTFTYQPRRNSCAHSGHNNPQHASNQSTLLSPTRTMPQITATGPNPRTGTPMLPARGGSSSRNSSAHGGIRHNGGGALAAESASTQLNPATTPVSQLLNLGLAGGCSPQRDMEPTMDVELPVHQNVNYQELLREQAIVERDCKDHNHLYNRLLEDLEDHIDSVKTTFNAMLTGKFELKEEDELKKKASKSKAIDSGVLPTNENFGSGGKNVAYILPSSPAYNRGGAMIHM